MSIDSRAGAGAEDAREAGSPEPLRVALIGSYTLDNLIAPLREALGAHGVDAEVRAGGYQQLYQDLLDPSSWIHAWRPDVTVVAVSSATLLPELEWEILRGDPERLIMRARERVRFLLDAVDQAALIGDVLLTSLDHFDPSPAGLADHCQEHGLRAIVEELNDLLRARARARATVHLLDFDRFVARVGRSQLTDPQLYYLGRMLLRRRAAESFAEELALHLDAIRGRLRRCLVVDLDNTLWGGVIGEDGVQGIRLGGDGIGAIYQDVHRILRNYRDMGFLLAISSKNDEADALAGLAHPESLLRPSDFAARRIDWRPKSTGIAELAAELHLGLESLAFLDDDPAERMEVSTRLPMVEVIDFPADVALLPGQLRTLPGFQRLDVTREDLRRSALYREQEERVELEESLGIDEYLHALGTEVRIVRDELPQLARIAQLHQKTNQFNLTTRRHSVSVLREMIEDPGHHVFSLHARDRFGDLGLTGVIVLRAESDALAVAGFLLSCRILGRAIEQVFLHEALARVPGRDRFATVRAHYRPTARNGQVRDLFDRLGFHLVRECDGARDYIARLVELTPPSDAPVTVLPEVAPRLIVAGDHAEHETHA